jgi:hypothetical protein
MPAENEEIVLDFDETDPVEKAVSVEVPENRDRLLEKLRSRTASREIRFIRPERSGHR